MKILIVDTYYPSFLRYCYSLNPGLQLMPYELQLRELLNRHFGTADYYSFNLNLIGCEATEVIYNCAELQSKWADENGLWLKEADISLNSLDFILYEQVKAYNPDVLYIQNIACLATEFLELLRPFVSIIVGQCAYPIPKEINLSGYDLLISSIPGYVEQFRSWGIESEYLKIGFEPRILEHLPKKPCRTHNAVFIGGYTSSHSQGNSLLEAVSKHVNIKFWGYGVENLSECSLIRRKYIGEAWGLDMYKILSSSKIVLNRHIDISGIYANNMRLYESTGVGACLLTDYKVNLDQLFEIDHEVVAYNSPDECIEKLIYLLENESLRASIAKAGQLRTFQNHTYLHRMHELKYILRKHLDRQSCTPMKISKRSDQFMDLPHHCTENQSEHLMNANFQNEDSLKFQSLSSVFDYLLKAFEIHPILLDIGASGCTPDIWDPISKHSVYIGFDPDLREIREISNGRYYRSLIINKAVVAQSGADSCDFYLTRSPYCSSTLPPDSKSLDNFLFSRLFDVERKVTVQSSTLEWVLKEVGVDRIDWLKTDSQGTDLRIIESLPDGVFSNLLAIDAEPGIINAYCEEDLFVDLQKLLPNQGFWLSNLNVCGTGRMKLSTLQKAIDAYPEINENALAETLKQTPGWCEARYLRTLEWASGYRPSQSQYLLLWIFSMIDRQLGFALDVSVDYAIRYGESPISHLLFDAAMWAIFPEQIEPPLLRYKNRLLNKIVF